MNGISFFGMDQKTKEQMLAVMLLFGTVEQQEEAMLFLRRSTPVRLIEDPEEVMA